LQLSFSTFNSKILLLPGTLSFRLNYRFRKCPSPRISNPLYNLYIKDKFIGKYELYANDNCGQKAAYCSDDFRQLSLGDQSIATYVNATQYDLYNFLMNRTSLEATTLFITSIDMQYCTIPISNSLIDLSLETPAPLQLVTSSDSYINLPYSNTTIGILNKAFDDAKGKFDCILKSTFY